MLCCDTLSVFGEYNQIQNELLEEFAHLKRLIVFHMYSGDPVIKIRTYAHGLLYCTGASLFKTVWEQRLSHIPSAALK